MRKYKTNLKAVWDGEKLVWQMPWWPSFQLQMLTEWQLVKTQAQKLGNPEFEGQAKEFVVMY